MFVCLMVDECLGGKLWKMRKIHKHMAHLSHTEIQNSIIERLLFKENASTLVFLHQLFAYTVFQLH